MDYRANGAVPDILEHLQAHNRARLESALAALTADERAQLDADLTIVATGSDFLCEQLERYPDLLAELVRSDLLQPTSRETLQQRITTRVAAAEDEESFLRVLRQLRRREMIRIIWRDLTRRADMNETTHTLSWMADDLIDAALNWLHPRCVARWGEPVRVDEAGNVHPLHMVVLGMGKLGAYELNLSSDIDLIFAFEDNGETRGDGKTLSNQEFFTRLGKRLIQALDSVTADGFVFRVDMRLRPLGSVGPLACSFGALETYYQDQGREWERYAMVKARCVAGDKHAAQELYAMLRPFVYRRYIDFSAFESLRAMKALINREVKLKHRDQNVKLGAGGIREVEFIVQAFQLIRGGKDRQLQQRELQNVLRLLPEYVGLPQRVVDELLIAYTFLRNTEHALQAVADRQTQELPVDETEQARLAYVMGFANWSEFSAQLAQQRAIVSGHFADVIADSEEECDSEDQQARLRWDAVWNAELDAEEALPYLQELGFTQPEQALTALCDLQQLRSVQMMQSVARDRLSAVMPRMLAQTAKYKNAEQTLTRVLKLIQAILRRSAYLVLLTENPKALEQLIRLCSASQWFADHISRNPGLLDELIDPSSLFTPPDKNRLRDELRQQLLRIPQEDTEQLMETLRYFRHAHILRVAASDITGALPLMKVSDYLTWLAEVLLDAVLDIAWKDMTAKYGVPMNHQGEPCDPGFIILGYGKLGGIELSYGSDLDLVFIYDAPGLGMTQGGPKEIANPVFFTRLGQRIIHLLSTRTPSGQLYEVDMRLRPSGNSGLLVSPLEAFANYQHKEAWTWEHQALVRARVVSGDTQLQQRFEAVRAEVLSAQRDPETLRDEVVKMREKMREHLGSEPNKHRFHLKQDAGGIVDIEFLVQYLALAYAHEDAELIRYTDNIRILDALAQGGYLSEQQADTLRESYKAYRAFGHRQTLQELPTLLDDEAFTQERQGVREIWQAVMQAPESAAH